LAHDVKVKVDIMVGGENCGCEFSHSEEMPKISACVTAADAAFTVRIDGILIFRITRVLNKDAALAGIEASVTCGARGENAIHHVNAERDVLRNLFGFADAHEIAQTILGKKGGDFGGHLASNFMRLSYCETAHSITGKINFEQLMRAFAAKVGKRCALHDSELPLL